MAIEPITRAHSARRPAGNRRQSAKTVRRKQQLARIHAERDAKAEVRERDQTCRWPGCDCQRPWGYAQGALWMRQLEVAHLVDKGMGGDKRQIRTQRKLMILICGWRHRGNFSLHSKRARIVPVNAEKGTDGLCEFFVMRKKDGPFELVGIG